MLVGYPLPAMLLSITSIFILYFGTFYSIKNILWGALLWLSFPASLWATFLRSFGESYRDSPNSWMYALTSLFGRGTEILFGSFCAMVLSLTAVGKLQEL
jgi:hypothetical protein